VQYTKLSIQNLRLVTNLWQFIRQENNSEVGFCCHYLFHYGTECIRGRPKKALVLRSSMIYCALTIMGLVIFSSDTDISRPFKCVH
jgi:hypothetical protein